MKTVADYQVLDQLRPGNHGTYYRATPPPRLELATDVVMIKVLNRFATNNEFSRMASELRAMNQVRHPHLVELLDAGHEQGRIFYSTREFPGGSLPIGPTENRELVVTAVADAADAAHALHEVGIVHRDIKPENILLDSGRGYLADLGVANYVDSDFTSTGNSVVGSIAYTDPTLHDGAPPGRESDVWSIGATLHAALTGESVLGRIPDQHLAAALGHAMSTSPTVAASCPQEVAELIQSCVGLDRLGRPATALAIAEELRRLL